jgi:hypothetical protein
VRWLAPGHAIQYLLMCGDEEDTLEAYKKEVLPAF